VKKIKLIISSIAAIAMGAISLPAITLAQESAPVYIQAQHSNKCLHVPGPGSNNGLQLTQWSCISQANVQWKIQRVGNSGEYRIKSVSTGKCAQVNNASAANGAIISQWDCVDQPNVLWVSRPLEDGYSHIINSQTGKCLHVDGATQNNNGKITQWDCANLPNIKWKFVRNPEVNPSSTPAPTASTAPQASRYRVKMWFSIQNSNDGFGDNTLELYGQTRIDGNIVRNIDRSQANNYQREAGQTIEMGEYVTDNPNIIVDGWLNDYDSGSADDVVFKIDTNINPRMSISAFVNNERRISYRSNGGEAATLHIRVDRI
jgi:Ricin-type beta-trefoil lectin domain